MDEQSLPDIAELLTGSIGANTRAATCTAIAACSADEAGAPLRHLIGTTTAGESIIRRLLILCADPASTRLALSALVNLSEDEDAASTMTRAAAVERCCSALLDNELNSQASLYSGLLSNLTRFPTGVDALIGKGKSVSASNAAVNTLLQLVTRIDSIPNVLWMSNACSTPEGRAALLLRGQSSATNSDQTSPTEQPISWLLRLLSSKSESIRLAAASALRNCAMAEDCHEMLVNSTNALGVCLASLITSSSAVTNDQVSNAPPEVRFVIADPSKAHHEPLIEIRLMLVESLLLLCKTQTGRDALLECDAYYVLDDWNKQEVDEQVKSSINSILLRITALEETEETSTEPSNGVKQITYSQEQTISGP